MMKFDLHQAMEILSRTPGVLKTLLDQLDPSWSHSNYGQDTFSPFDAVGHLIEADRHNWMPRVAIILGAGENKAFPPFDRHAMFDRCKNKTMSDLLNEFTQLRRANLKALGNLRLTTEQLNLTGVHPELGPATLQQLTASWVVHDLHHLHQIARAMAFQYLSEVGPWKRYLSILPQS